MKVISVTKNMDLANVSLSGCVMKCGYCMHSRQDRKDMTLESIVHEVCGPAVRRVYIGGMEPLVHQKELPVLIHTLKQRGLEITLKTSGHDPAFLLQLLPSIDRLVFEVKAPLDDVKVWTRLSGHDEAWTMRYLEDLKRSLEMAKGKHVRIMTRAIPGFISDEIVERLGAQLAPYAQEALLTQFLGNRMNDYPWNGINDASPPEEEMMRYGEALSRHIPQVRVTGSGFERSFRR
ncbi:MAG: 7-carboxy-7-deazaguanine synthase [Methanomassiliicoccales archaeon PtaU1.Bin124]|nr:MAG: 7-carboxy-7-deazaguanine synthase [Methanomassiliicoccales archaeon PtaU1.Bin124]